MPLCIFHIVISCSRHISFTRITLDLCHGKSEVTFLCQEALKLLIFFLDFCERLLTIKYKTKLADIKLSEATNLILLGFSGKLYSPIMVLLFANIMQIFQLLKISYACILPRSAELQLTITKLDRKVWENRARGYKTFFMLNSAEHEICPANKSHITNNCKFFLSEHSWAWNFLC